MVGRVVVLAVHAYTGTLQIHVLMRWHIMQSRWSRRRKFLLSFLSESGRVEICTWLQRVVLIMTVIG